MKDHLIKKMTLALFFTVSLFSTQVFATENDQSMDEKLKELKLEKIQADIIVAQLEESGRFDESEVRSVKREIASVEEDALAEISKNSH